MKIYGPVQLDCVNEYWQVIGPRGGVLGTFYTKKEARQFIRESK